MNCVSKYPQLSETYEKVRILSFEEKKAAVSDENKMNTLLDAILDLKKMISHKTEIIEELITELESITWIDESGKNELMLINDIVSSLKDFRSTLIRFYVSMNFIREKGIAKTEINQFKNAIDDLKEMTNDLESRFFILPSMPEFQETTKELSLV